MEKKVKDLILDATNKLRSITDTPSLDVSILFEKATGMNKTTQISYPNKLITKNQEKIFNNLINRRLKKEPIAYIIEEKSFYTSDFKVTKDTLIPRPDTEVLVEKAINYINTLDFYPEILDLCTGTGAVGISIGLETEYQSLTLSDISKKALEVAKYNAIKLLNKKPFKIIESNLLDNCQKYDIIVTNPPYLTKEWIEMVEDEVKKEPILALDGFGNDGLDIIRKIIKDSTIHFNNNKGIIFIECDSRQCVSVKDILKNNNFKKIEIYQDLGNRDRVVKGIYG